ncbi:hypothetical protein [Staphylococcus epidermidis]|uniref:hypothetical protein n=1 Tax=Staphylococcus epidermidis TaxID=1282 RepID=UPI0011A76730|nr:hypothetical protein [Staphylococcus epidermidis]
MDKGRKYGVELRVIGEERYGNVDRDWFVVEKLGLVIEELKECIDDVKELDDGMIELGEEVDYFENIDWIGGIGKVRRGMIIGEIGDIKGFK